MPRPQRRGTLQAKAPGVPGALLCDWRRRVGGPRSLSAGLRFGEMPFRLAEHGGALVEIAVDGGARNSEQVGDLLHGFDAGVVELLGEGGLAGMRRGRRPPTRPRARAAAVPSLVLAMMSWRCSSARTDSMPDTARPSDVDVSMPCSITCRSCARAAARRVRRGPIDHRSVSGVARRRRHPGGGDDGCRRGRGPASSAGGWPGGEAIRPLLGLEVRRVRPDGRDGARTGAAGRTGRGRRARGSRTGGQSGAQDCAGAAEFRTLILRF